MYTHESNILQETQGRLSISTDGATEP